MKMPFGRQTGFTIIEVSIFLAISSLMLVIAIAGTANAINTNRFTDTMRSTQAYVQSQYAAVLNGLNPRGGNEICNSSIVSTGGSSQAGTSNCYLMGKLIQFSGGGSVIKSYYVVGSAPTTAPQPGLSDEALVAEYGLHAVQNVAADSFNIPWAATVEGSCAPITVSTGTCYGSKSKVDSYLVVRSPATGNILTYAFKAGGFPSGNGDLSSYVTVANHTSTGTNAETNVCIKSSDNGFEGMIMLAPSGGEAGIVTNFDRSLDVTYSQMCAGA